MYVLFSVPYISTTEYFIYIGCGVGGMALLLVLYIICKKFTTKIKTSKKSWGPNDEKAEGKPSTTVPGVNDD